jgi:hypothetical protein
VNERRGEGARAHLVSGHEAFCESSIRVQKCSLASSAMIWRARLATAAGLFSLGPRVRRRARYRWRGLAHDGEGHDVELVPGRVGDLGAQWLLEPKAVSGRPSDDVANVAVLDHDGAGELNGIG